MVLLKCLLPSSIVFQFHPLQKEMSIFSFAIFTEKVCTNFKSHIMLGGTHFLKIHPIRTANFTKLKLVGSRPWMRLGHKVQTDANLWPSWQAEGSCLQQPTLRSLTSPFYGSQDTLHLPRVTDGRALSGYILTRLTLPWPGPKA